MAKLPRPQRSKKDRGRPRIDETADNDLLLPTTNMDRLAEVIRAKKPPT